MSDAEQGEEAPMGTGDTPGTAVTGDEPGTAAAGDERDTAGEEPGTAAGRSANKHAKPDRPPGPPPRPGVTVSRPVAAGLAALLVLAVAAAVTFGVLLTRRTGADDSAQQALATAKAYAVTVTSYDYQNLDRNFADVLDGATGEFKDQYSGASQSLRQLISQAKATAKGSVLAAGIQSASPDEVQVLVFVDQGITNAATPQPRLDRNRVLMTLTPHDGRWLVRKLELM
ncbi:MAG TPA: hypothetical protein VGH99_16040 [Pseudonocardia sp.]|jgi:Mce-associated membrane protein